MKELIFRYCLEVYFKRKVHDIDREIQQREQQKRYIKDKFFISRKSFARNNSAINKKIKLIMSEKSSSQLERMASMDQDSNVSGEEN